MSARKIVLDLTDPRPRAPSVCPACGAALSSVDGRTVRRVTVNFFRCLPGRRPLVFEGRCGGCGRFLVFLKREQGLELAAGNQDDLLKSIRNAEREYVVFRKGRDDER